MKVTYRWLKEYVDFTDSAAQIADKLTNAGFEVEELRPLVPPFHGVVVGKVTRVDKHPNADKLSICTVETSEDAYQVICGAPNVAAGQSVPFARVGAELPNGFKIKKAKIRGVESFGMICSKEELGLEKQSDGIWAFEQDFAVGEDVYRLLSEQQDYLFDFFITPNRPDCLSVTGIAREAAALTGGTLKLPQPEVPEVSALKTEASVRVAIEDAQGCPRYAARLIRDVHIKPSPRWMQERLEAVGIRPINNIVDITNYVLMELGQPLHAFDLSQVSGGQIIVRSSQPGEKFVTLDDKERTLPERTVMICDAEKAVAIGGIMGGQNSEVSEHTRDVLLESAYFHPERIARSSKKLGLSTEASQRFERGTDPNGVIRAANRAAQLMAELAGGKVATGIVDVYPQPILPKKIALRPERVNRVLGAQLSTEQIESTLKSIGMKIQGSTVEAPTFRPDLLQEIDLIEEVARLVNFSNLPTNEKTALRYEIPESTQDNLVSYLRENTLQLGLQEVFTNSMLKEREAAPFYHGEAVRILNPISDDMAVMRPSLLPGLLRSTAYNINRNMTDVRIFEIGRMFRNYVQNQLPEQPYGLAAAISGRRFRENWSVPPTKIDFYDIKGYLENFLLKISLDNWQFILYDKASYMAENECLAVRCADEIIGVCGKIKPEISELFGISDSVYAFELNVDLLQKHLSFERKYQPIARYPYSERDMALVLDERVSAGTVLDLIRQTGAPLLSEVDVFDVYTGDKIPPGQKSLAIRMRFQSKERTLSDKEVDKVFHKIIRRSEKEFDAHLRD